MNKSLLHKLNNITKIFFFCCSNDCPRYFFAQLANFSWSIWAFTMARDQDQDFDYVGQVILNRVVMVMVFIDTFNNISALGGDILNRLTTFNLELQIYDIQRNDWLIDWLLVFNATFRNISAISWRPVLVVEEAGYTERTTDHGHATGKLYHLRLRVECTLFVIYKSWHEPTPYWW